MFTYLKCGVDSNKVAKLNKNIKNYLGEKNGKSFAGIIEHPILKEYYLACCCDGIGSKLIALKETNNIKTIVTDLIAMNFNDLCCIGASPLFFADYLAVNNLDVNFTSELILELKTQLEQNYNCILACGETSQLRDIITKNNFDISGFAVGIVRKDKLIKYEDKVKENNEIIGLCSNGIHANGFSLIRKLYKENLLNDFDYKQTLNPCHIYLKKVIELNEKNLINGVANITGGGLAENISRIIPKYLCAKIIKNNIKNDKFKNLFNKLISLVGEQEAYNTFNMGVGLCLIVDKTNTKEVLSLCKEYNPFILGEIIRDENCNFCFG